MNQNNRCVRVASRENYQYPPGTNGSFGGLPVRADVVQKTQTACPDCYSIQQATKVRTLYDQYMIKRYDILAQQSDTDLMTLQFLH